MIETGAHLSQIDGNLYMGCTPVYYGGQVNKEFIAVVNLYPWKDYNWHLGQLMVKWPIFDSAHQPDVPAPRDEVLHELATLVNRLREIGPVLVHCEQGLNRSGLVVALSLMKRGLTADDAIYRVRQSRPGSLFNEKFCAWLRAA